MNKNINDINNQYEFHSKKQLKRNSAEFMGSEQTSLGSTYEIYRTPDGKILKTKFRTNIVHYKKTAQMAFFKTKEELEKENANIDPNLPYEENLRQKMGEEKYAKYLKRKQYIQELNRGK